MLCLKDPKTLSKRAIEILRLMAANKDEADGELVVEGLEVWIGYQRTSRKVSEALLNCCFISLADGRHDGYGVYVINSSGERFLAGLPPYCDRDGNYHKTMFTMLRT